MSAGIDKAENDADKFASTVLHCSHNAEKYLKIRDYHKASEMMRGAVSCVIKAVAAKQNKQLKSHNRVLADYAREFAKNKTIKRCSIRFQKRVSCIQIFTSQIWNRKQSSRSCKTYLKP